MKNLSFNAVYFLQETKALLWQNRVSSFFSFLSCGLILFILAMVISGGWVSSRVAAAIQGEAEISVYFREDMDQAGIGMMVANIRKTAGVRAVRLVPAAEAYRRMAEILGQDARVLGYFQENPFSPFIEANIELTEIGPILETISGISGVEQIRDNRQVLDRLRQLSAALGYLGLLVVAAVGIATLVIAAHLTRMAIQQNREQIDTLRLLGAPPLFIAVPFVLEGMLLTMAGSLLAAGLGGITLGRIYAYMAGPLPFLPLPPLNGLVRQMAALIILLGAVLGLAGSIFGLAGAKDR